MKSGRAYLNSALVQAVFHNKTDLVEPLLAAGADPNQTTSIGTLLMCASMSGHLQVVKALLGAGADLNRVSKGESALSAALSEKQTKVVQYLERVGAMAPPNAALLYASIHGDLGRARDALTRGADVDKPGGMFKQTPLSAAAENGFIEIVQLLLDHGAKPNKKVEGRCTLHDAVRGKSAEIVRTLVAAGADLRAKYYSETLLMSAAEGGSLPIVRWLVDQGADVHARDETGKTALDFAKAAKHKDIVAFLNSLGVTAERDIARKLCQAIAREFGGKPVEHSHGFLINSKVHGYKAQFQVIADEGAVSVFGGKLIDPELNRAPGTIWFGGPQSISEKGARKLRLPPPRSEMLNVQSENGSELDRTVLEFCNRHEQLLRQMEFSSSESIRISPKGIRYKWAGREIGRVLPRLKCFSQFVGAVTSVPQIAKPLVESVWLLKRAAKSTKGGALHSFGGALEQKVACPGCGGRTNLMAQLNLGDPVLPRTTLGIRKLPLFWCLTCLEWDPVFYDISGNRPVALEPSGKPFAAEPGLNGEPDLPAEVMMLTAVPDGRAGRKSKVGGEPAWAQLEQVPECPKCKSPMPFVAQLASDSRIAFADMGLLYAFACPGCKVVATLIQSH